MNRRPIGFALLAMSSGVLVWGLAGRGFADLAHGSPILWVALCHLNGLGFLGAVRLLES